MGTNFYWYEKPVCPHCGHQPEGKHIGKSSAGWCFGLHVYPEGGINTLEDWRLLYETGEIRDEYGDVILPRDMTRRITERSWRSLNSPPLGYSSIADFHRVNHSEYGPNDLMRHQIDARHCIGHGEGTWDYMIGNFS